VWLAARRLHDALAGQRITTSDLRVPRLATEDLSGRVVAAVAARGKHLLTRLDDGRTLHSHLRMDGAWHLYRAGAAWRGGPAYQIRAVLQTPGWAAIGYRLHELALVATEAESDLVGHLGPDLLGPDWDLEEAVRRLRAHPEREIGPALLDQRNLAGIGNLYKTEALFLRGVSPYARVGEIDVAAVARMAQRLMRANRDRWEQTTTGNPRRGQEHWVFERQGRPCRRCGTTVLSTSQAEADRPEHARLSYWCPRCQPAPQRPGDARSSPPQPGTANRRAAAPATSRRSGRGLAP